MNLPMRQGIPDYALVFSNCIFSRLLVYGMFDRPGYIAQAKSMLAPGNRSELQKIDLGGLLNREQSLISGYWGQLKEQQDTWTQRPLDMNCASRLEGYFWDAGFQEVHTEEFRWMFGPWKGHLKRSRGQNTTQTLSLAQRSELPRRSLGRRRYQENHRGLAMKCTCPAKT